MTRAHKEPLNKKIRKAQTQKGARPLTKSNYELAASLRSSIFRLERNIRRQSRSMGRSAIEIHVLHTLDRNPGSTQTELAHLEQISRPSMGAHVRKLIGLGCIRAASGDKSRAGSPVKLYLTRRGRALAQQEESPRKDWLTQRLDLLKSTDQKQLFLALESLQLLVEEGRIETAV